MIVPLALLGLIVLVVVPIKLAQWHATRPRAAEGPSRAPVRERRKRIPQLPEGHRPPPGLGPLSPSERFLQAETARGLRDLQLFLSNPA